MAGRIDGAFSAENREAFLSGDWLRAKFLKWAPENYWISFYGTPSAVSPWGWQFSGHHLALNISVEGNRVRTMSPSFVGTEPAIFSYNGVDYEAVIDMHLAGYAVFAALDSAQKAAADAGKVPKDVLTGPGNDGVIPPAIGLSAKGDGEGGQHKPGRGTKKAPVIGAVERGGNVTARAVTKDKMKSQHMGAFMRGRIDTSKASLITDEYKAYLGMAKVLPHAVIKHSDWYVDGDIHTNTIEGFPKRQFGDNLTSVFGAPNRVRFFPQPHSIGAAVTEHYRPNHHVVMTT